MRYFAYNLFCLVSGMFSKFWFRFQDCHGGLLCLCATFLFFPVVPALLWNLEIGCWIWLIHRHNSLIFFYFVNFKCVNFIEKVSKVSKFWVDCFFKMMNAVVFKLAVEKMSLFYTKNVFSPFSGNDIFCIGFSLLSLFFDYYSFFSDNWKFFCIIWGWCCPKFFLENWVDLPLLLSVMNISSIETSSLARLILFT